MIDRSCNLTVTRQAELLGMSRGAVYYLSRPTSAADLAYLSNAYTLFDKAGKEVEKGNFLQIWKFRKGSWRIVLDLFTGLSHKN